MKKISILLVALSFCFLGQAQYEFTTVKDITCTPIKNQARTGTCWSFATSSFIESELIRMGKGQHDLSEMYTVRNIYQDKARNYVYRQGKANFSQGSLSHDLLSIVSQGGVMPESVYSGLLDNSKHDHSEMEKGLKGFLDGVIQSKSLSSKWPIAFESILDAYLGPCPTEFNYKGKKYTPASLAKELSIDPTEYVNLTSFTHHPFNESFILEIPDNYSNGSFYNIPLDDLKKAVDHALKNGFSIAWDGDVSEKGFSAREGIAILPETVDDDIFKNPVDEKNVTQASRQASFESYSTTDDHLMHIVGTAKDQKGNRYYIIKNSWGEISDFKGYLYMSEAYFLAKTVSVLIHEDGIPKGTIK